jgi:hypothetical protein
MRSLKGANGFVHSGKKKNEFFHFLFFVSLSAFLQIRARFFC